MENELYYNNALYRWHENDDHYIVVGYENAIRHYETLLKDPELEHIDLSHAKVDVWGVMVQDGKPIRIN